jgi:hypothetical protein
MVVTLNQILRRNEPGQFGNNVVDARHVSNYSSIAALLFRVVCGLLLSVSPIHLTPRSSDRFYTRVPEPRAGIQGGHIPGTRNVPFGTVGWRGGCFALFAFSFNHSVFLFSLFIYLPFLSIPYLSLPGWLILSDAARWLVPSA